MSMSRIGSSLLLSAFLLYFCYVSFSMKEKHFSKVGKGGSFNFLLSNHSVLSSVECGQYCLRSAETCTGFNYKSGKTKHINCQLNKQSNIKRRNGNGEWMYYKTLPVVSSLHCPDNSVCRNGGKCVKVSYNELKCECDVKYEGERCEQERVFDSCSQILNISRFTMEETYLCPKQWSITFLCHRNYIHAKDGVYKIRTTNSETNYTYVYCQMTSLEGCEGGGWTMVMKVNGSNNTFQYNSTFWINKESFNLQDGQTAFDLEETKLPTFWSTSFKEICIGMRAKNDLNFLSFRYPASSLYSLFADGVYRDTSLPREKWKSLLAGSSLQTGCCRQGFNVNTKLLYMNVRLGYIGNEQEHCGSSDSYIGIGGQHRSDIVHCSSSISDAITAGNIGRCAADNGNVDIKAMAYILIR